MSDFVHYDFVGVNAGSIVRVEIDSIANVILVDDTGFRAYRNGQQFEYWGGEQRQSPIIFRVPRYGNWHVVIDLGGRSGRIRHSAQLLSAA